MLFKSKRIDYSVKSAIINEVMREVKIAEEKHNEAILNSEEYKNFVENFIASDESAKAIMAFKDAVEEPINQLIGALGKDNLGWDLRLVGDLKQGCLDRCTSIATRARDKKFDSQFKSSSERKLRERLEDLFVLHYDKDGAKVIETLTKIVSA